MLGGEKTGNCLQTRNEKWYKNVNKVLQNENGQSLVLMALVLTVMIGMAALVIDVGFMYLTKSQLQKAADAACMAGAQELPGDPDAAESVARSYAEANGTKTSDIVTVTIPANNRSICVKIERDLPMLFAGILAQDKYDDEDEDKDEDEDNDEDDDAQGDEDNTGDSDGESANETVFVSADATASIGVAASVPWIVPFVIPKPNAFNYDQVYVMRMYGAGPYPSGYGYPADYKAAYSAYPKSNPYPYHFDYMNVKIKAGSNPSSEFSDYLKYLQFGYHETFSLSQNMLYYAPSSGGIPSVDTFQKRISTDPNTDYTKAKIGDPRVMLIPIVQTMLPRSTAENTKVKIIGFTGFWLQSVHKNSYYETFWFEGRFLEDLNVGSGEVTFDPNADFGLRVVKLTE